MMNRYYNNNVNNMNQKVFSKFIIQINSKIFGVLQILIFRGIIKMDIGQKMKPYRNKVSKESQSEWPWST